MRWMAHRFAVFVLGLVLLAAQSTVQAQAWPNRPIKLIVGYSPGGAVDVVARALGQQISAALGQPVIVDNRPGAGTNIAMRALIDSPPDGYTLMLTANAVAANVSLFQPPPYDIAKDLTPIALVGRVPVVLAAMSAQRVSTMPEAPTIAESGFPGFEASVWHAFIAPKGTPPAIVAKLNAEIHKALADPEVKERLAGLGAEVAPTTPQELATLVRTEYERYGKLIREANIKVN